MGWVRIEQNSKYFFGHKRNLYMLYIMKSLLQSTVLFIFHKVVVVDFVFKQLNCLYVYLYNILRFRKWLGIHIPLPR